MITKRTRLKVTWVDKRTEIAGQFKKLCKAECIQNYSTMSETNAAFAERTIGSLEDILHRYMEDNVYKYLHKLTQFVTTLKSRKNWSTDLILKNIKNSDVLSNLYSEPLGEFWYRKFKIADRVRISKRSLPFRKGYKPQFTKKVFEIVAICCRNPPSYIKKDEQDEIFYGYFYQKELIQVFLQRNRLQ